MNDKLSSFLIIILFFTAGCSSLKKDVFIKNRRLACEKVSLAVLPFNDVPGQPGSGLKVANTLTAELIRVSNWSLIERSRLDAIMKEKSLDATGLTTADFAEIGRITKTDFLIIGNVSEYHHGKKALIVEQTKLSYRARIVDVRSGSIAGTVTLDMETGKNAWIGCIFLSWYYIPLALFTEQNISKDMSKSAKEIVSMIDYRIEEYRDDNTCK